ncbi:MAG: hypothetical protein KF756_03465 [Acidobacteria bacterium]|nr:hypothetical protein [Acidobacteriota bacterium]
MKAPLSLITFCSAAVFLISCGKPQIKGEVFVVTEGQQAYKLALVTVNAVPESTVKSCIDTTQTENKERASEAMQQNAAALRIAEKELDDAKNERARLEASFAGIDSSSVDEVDRRIFLTIPVRERIEKASQKLREIKAASSKYELKSYWDCFVNESTVSQTTTRSDGKFTLSLPRKGTYIVTASASRKIISTTEYYNWFVWVDASSQNEITVSLNNTNLADPYTPNYSLGPQNGTANYFGN